MSYTMRTTKPTASNKYYVRKVNGGYSDAIQGSPADSECDVLANCVGYAYGRFNEIGGWGCCKYLRPVNAENFIQYKGSLEVGQVPRLGACMVWQKGATLSGSDGAGHVAIVEKVISDTEVYTSESAYGGKAFYNQTRKKGSDGKWGMGSDYKFLGFIYNPAPCCKDTGTGVAVGTDTNVIYKSLGTAAKRKGASISAALDSRCVKGGYYAASQLVMPAAGAQQWFRHADIELYSALTDTDGSTLFSKYGNYATGKTNAVVNVRSAAGMNGAKLAQFQKGVSVYLTGKTAQTDGLTWIEIVYDGKLAWCDKQWVDC